MAYSEPARRPIGLAVSMAEMLTAGGRSAAQVSVSVLVPVLNEGDGVSDVIAAMQSQRYPAGEIEFIFADGRSEDDTRAQLEQAAAEDPRIRVLENPRRGTASGLNVCLAAARGEYIARMDAHTVYPPEYLALGVERLRRGGAAWVAGPQVPEGVGAVGKAVAAALASLLGRGGSRKWEGAQDEGAAPEYDLDTGVFCGVWRRDDLLRMGGFDEQWPRNQDSELAARFLREGRRIVCLASMGASYRPRESLGPFGGSIASTGSIGPRRRGAIQRAFVAPPCCRRCSCSTQQPSRLRRGLSAALLISGWLLMRERSLLLLCRASGAASARLPCLCP